MSLSFRRRHWVAMTLALGCQACSLLSPVGAPVETSVIDTMPSSVAQAARKAGVMLVETPAVQPAFDTARMAYSLKPHDVDYYLQREWAERPGPMLQPLLVQALERTRCCSAIVASPGGGVPVLTLRVFVRELLQDFTGDAPAVRLAWRVELRDRARVLLAQDIVVAEPMRARNAQAGVEAANEATAKALQELAAKVVKALDAR